MKNIIKLSTLCASFLIVTGCASIAGNNTRAVNVQSYPSGAAIYVDNQQYGVTPAVITLPNYIYGGKSITLRKPGYQEQTQMVSAQFQPITLLNVFFTPGFFIDIATGDIVKIDPASLNLRYKMRRA